MRIAEAYREVGEDFALFIDRDPGTFSFLGVRGPESDIVTAAPHFPTFDPGQWAIGHRVRSMTGRLAERAGRKG